jgi:mersacidin/lichenicidin family type 2 lantibiotic
MTIANIIRAWEDPEYRKSLRAEELPENPVGQIELAEDELTEVMGAQGQSGASFTCNTKKCMTTRGQSDHCTCP